MCGLVPCADAHGGWTQTDHFYFRRCTESLPTAVGLAALAICIRPTTIPLWAYLGVEHVFMTSRKQGVLSAAAAVFTSITVGYASLAAASPQSLIWDRLAVLAMSTMVDYTITGRILVPSLTFIHQNLFRSLSSFYGATNPFYHLTQSLPILLFPIWYWWAEGFFSCLLPRHWLPNRLATLDRPDGLRMLARALTFSIAVLSLSPHSEWRFLHPFLPSLLLFALPPLFRSYNPTIAAPSIRRAIRQYLRIPQFQFFLILLAPMLPYLYLNVFHGRAQVGVMDVLRRGDVGNVTGLVALMPCHSTPWMSALHKEVDGWFLTCEPPLG